MYLIKVLMLHVLQLFDAVFANLMQYYMKYLIVVYNFTI
jgi:hypothetical protein